MSYGSFISAYSGKAFDTGVQKLLEFDINSFGWLVVKASETVAQNLNTYTSIGNFVFYMYTNGPTIAGSPAPLSVSVVEITEEDLTTHISQLVKYNANIYRRDYDSDNTTWGIWFVTYNTESLIYIGSDEPAVLNDKTLWLDYANGEVNKFKVYDLSNTTWKGMEAGEYLSSDVYGGISSNIFNAYQQRLNKSLVSLDIENLQTQPVVFSDDPADAKLLVHTVDGVNYYYLYGKFQNRTSLEYFYGIAKYTIPDSIPDPGYISVMINELSEFSDELPLTKLLLNEKSLIAYSENDNNHWYSDALKYDSLIWLDNLILNGDFHSGTTGWIILYGGSTINIIGDNLYDTGNGTSNYVGVYYASTSYPSDHKVYFNCKVKIINGNNPYTVESFLRVADAGYTYGLVNIHSPENDVEYMLTSITTMPIMTGPLYLYIRLYYSNPINSTGTLQIIRASAIDLTDAFCNGIAGTGNEPSQSQMDTLIAKFPNSWFVKALISGNSVNLTQHAFSDGDIRYIDSIDNKVRIISDNGMYTIYEDGSFAYKENLVCNIPTDYVITKALYTGKGNNDWNDKYVISGHGANNFYLCDKNETVEKYGYSYFMDEWTTQNSGTSNALLSITYDNGIYVAVGANGTILTSPDAITWTSQYNGSGITSTLYKIAYGNELYIISGQGGIILTSPDGINWSSQSSGTSNTLLNIIYANDLFIAVGVSGTILTSPDGINWSSQSSGTSYALYGIIYANDLYISVGQNGTILTSPDAITWTSQYNGSGTISTFTSIAYGNDLFVTVGGSGRTAISSNGIDWTGVSATTTNSLYSLIYRKGIYLATGDNGTILTSHDAITWTIRTSNNSNSLRDSIFNNLLIIVGYSGTILTTSSILSDAYLSESKLYFSKDNFSNELNENKIVYSYDLSDDSSSSIDESLQLEYSNQIQHDPDSNICCAKINESINDVTYGKVIYFNQLSDITKQKIMKLDDSYSSNLGNFMIKNNNLYQIINIAQGSSPNAIWYVGKGSPALDLAQHINNKMKYIHVTSEEKTSFNNKLTQDQLDTKTAGLISDAESYNDQSISSDLGIEENAVVLNDAENTYTTHKDTVAGSDFSGESVVITDGTEGNQLTDLKINGKSELQADWEYQNGDSSDSELPIINIIPSSYRDFSTLVAYGGAALTITQNQTVNEWNTTTATRVQTSGGTSTTKAYVGIKNPSISGVLYHTIIYIRNNNSTDIDYTDNITHNHIVAGSIIKLDFISIGNGASNLQMNFKVYSIDDTVDVTVWNPQIYVIGKAPDNPYNIVSTYPSGTYKIACPTGGYWELTLDDDLRGISTYYDKIELDVLTGKGKLKRNIGKKVFDGTEVWSGPAVTTENNNSYYCTISDAKLNTYSLCSHLKYDEVYYDIYDAEYVGITSRTSVGGVIVSIPLLTATNATGLKSWLAAQYSAGTPVTVYYVLATKVTTNISLTHVDTSSATEIDPTSLGISVQSPDYPYSINNSLLNEGTNPCIKRNGKNLLNINAANKDACIVNEDGTVTSNKINKYYCNFSTSDKYICNLALNGYQLTFSYKAAITDKRTSIVIFGNRTDGSSYQENGAYFNSVTISPTLFTSISGIEFRFNRTGYQETDTTTIFSNFQVEIGNKNTPYEPYIAPQSIDVSSAGEISNVSTISDYIEFDGTDWYLHKLIGKKVFDGTEPLNKNSGDATNYLYFYTHIQDGIVHQNNGHVACSHLVEKSSPPISVIGIEYAYAIASVPYCLYMNFGEDIMTKYGNTVSGLQTYLAAQYAAGTPLTVYYQLATPVVTKLSITDIPTILQGYNKFSIENSIIQPTIQIKYNSSMLAHLSTDEAASLRTFWNNTSPIDHTHLSDDKVEIDASKVVSGKFAKERLPAGVVNTVHTVASESAKDALTSSDVAKGDVVHVYDNSGEELYEQWYRITNIDTEGVITYINFTSTLGYATPFSALTGVPTTVAGYGITDLYTKTTVDTNNTNAYNNVISYNDDKFNNLQNFYYTKVLNSSLSNINKIEKFDKTYIAIGNNGAIYSLINPDHWTRYNSGTTSDLLDMVCFYNLFIIVGGDGVILLSTDNGITWEAQTSGISTDLYSITYSNNLFITVGNNGVILTSPDGITWTSRTSGTTNTLYSVIYNDSMFIVVGTSGTILTSTDGTTWTSQTSNTENDLYSISYVNNLYIATGYNGTILTSSDATTWTVRTSGTTDLLFGAFYLNGIYVISKYNDTILTSSDAITWTDGTIKTSGSDLIMTTNFTGNISSLTIGTLDATLINTIILNNEVSDKIKSTKELTFIKTNKVIYGYNQV